jgi:molybdenum cofactor cytidylyltransferase
MAAAAWTDPELIRRPRHALARIAHVHLGAAALTANLKVTVRHTERFLHRFAIIHYHRSVIPAIVLAAGKSTRMGRPKANLPLEDGDTFLSRIVRTFSNAAVDDVVVVLGHDADAIARAFAGTGVAARFVINPDYETGQLSSLLKGLNAVDRPGLTAALVTLVDVPLVDVRTVRAVIDHYRQTRAPIVRPIRGQQHGHPVLIDRSLFDEIRRADPGRGAKAVVRAHASAMGDVEVDDDGAFLDIDTADEYERLVGPRVDR